MTTLSQCRSLGCECIIHHDDERRKPNSRAYINSLNERIAALENALREKEQAASTTNTAESTDQRHTSHSPVLAQEDGDPMHTQPKEVNEQNEAVVATGSDATEGYSPPANLSMPSNESMVNKLLSTRGHLSFDQLSGRLRYFGPTTNCHVHSDLHLQNEHLHRQALEQERRMQRVINTLTTETHNYLMDMFWTHYNPVIHVIHRAAFEECRDNEGPFYSGFLHVCILAIGYRCADKSRPDMIKISMANRESTLHKEAKFMLDYEIEQPGGISSIQALLLLGDLECGVGRDNVGWLYAGMANRLCFDIGLHLDRSKSVLSEREIEIGKMTLFACVIYDKYWALFLGRPTSLKSSDLETYGLSHKFERLGKCLPAGPEMSLETQIYESLLDLMEIAGTITELMDQASRLDDNVNVNHHVFLRMANLNRELEIWYTRLPKALQWTPENVQLAPFSFFLLHQQYHVSMILLHRPFARYGDIQSSNSDGNMEDYTPQPNMHLSAMSRTICTQHAVRIARVFWQHRQRFDTRRIFVTGLQHAGTAATALVAALASLKDSSRDANMHYLETLGAALEDMSETYQPAERMSAVLQSVIAELRATMPQPQQTKVVPARRESTNDGDTQRFAPSGKRHQLFRASPPRTMSQAFEPQTQPHPTAYGGLHEPQDTSMPNQPSNQPANQPSVDGFVVVTPHEEPANLDEAWHTMPDTDPSVRLDYPMFTNKTWTAFNNNGPAIPTSQTSAWMGAETPAVSPPPSSNPFLFQSSAFQSQGRLQADPLGSNVHNLDFLSLLSGDRGDFRNDDFGILPTPRVTPATAFQPRPSTESNKSADRGSVQSREQQDGSAAKTMAALDELWNQMRPSNRDR
ncbi:hypothetical protein LTR96_010977 [Exophiala xenobiotica]|nr:hypothetical protein LTR41_011210 [Exophiala xenobiotica]KAK5215035.1 hypothetical protein LTR72_011878 [Exophiala xenobiotica]KAK5263636.1 hypothetical protein LTR96_010977 [Exophiala xenobiotica]KAK5284894.1 hypothetical protein LTR14_011401 [Exophiala xenobiotica]KAK5332862.1 hypothetical protein LTR98_011019 [Exophiala xenobiotica]